MKMDLNEALGILCAPESVRQAIKEVINSKNTAYETYTKTQFLPTIQEWFVPLADYYFSKSHEMNTKLEKKCTEQMNEESTHLKAAKKIMDNFESITLSEFKDFGHEMYYAGTSRTFALMYKEDITLNHRRSDAFREIIDFLQGKTCYVRVSKEGLARVDDKGNIKNW
jgi:hypothetical protein